LAVVLPQRIVDAAAVCDEHLPFGQEHRGRESGRAGSESRVLVRRPGI
jgi:hypothetical protein